MSVQTRVSIAQLRIQVTRADASCVGSVTVDAVLCDYLGFVDRQLVQVRSEATGCDLWTYVECGRCDESASQRVQPPGTLRLDGAAAHLVNVGDVVNVVAWASVPVQGVGGGASHLPERRTWDAVRNGFEPEGGPPPRLWASSASIEIAVGKVHRPRITAVRRIPEDEDAGGVGPSIAIDRYWAEEVGMLPGQSAHIVIVPRHALKPGGKLYVDCVPKSAAGGAVLKRQGSLPESEGGASVELEWEFEVDEERRERKWSSTTTVDEFGQAKKRTMNTSVTALLVREQEVRSVLSYVGFGMVEAVVCEGETVYQPLIADKPAAEVGYYDRQVERYRRVWNDNGKILWGLFDKVAPYVMTPEMAKMSVVNGKGALVGPNMAMQAFMESKLDPIEVKSILDVGCGTGRSTIDLAKRFPGALCVGCDPSGVSIKLGTIRAKDEGVAGRVSFFHGTVQDLIGSNTLSTGAFSAAWSEAALCHAPPADRADSLRAIADQLDDGGMFVLNDAVAGLAPVSAAAQLHFYERLHYDGLWTGRMYMEVLESCGLQVVEYVDLTPHLAASYATLSKEAHVAADDAGDDAEARQTYETLAVDYKITSDAGLRGELGWNLFVCKKVCGVAALPQSLVDEETDEKEL